MGHERAAGPIADLLARTEEHLNQARALALAGSAGASPAWDAYLISLGVEPLQPERRAEICTAGMPQEKGVLPAEFRLALMAIREGIGAEVRRLPKEGQSEAAEDARERLEARLENLVASELKRYLKDVRPAVSAMSIFANAMQTTARAAELADTVNTKTCPTCSAARLKEKDLGRCAYCGHDYRLSPGG